MTEPEKSAGTGQGDRQGDRQAEGLEEQLLHGLFLSPGDRGDADAMEEWKALCAQPDAQRELEDLRGFLATCRGALQPSREPVAGQLAERILKVTTRQQVPGEDPSWRGDLRLVQGFMKARWKASWVLRVAAASLILHVGALPLLAYFGFGDPPAEFALKFAPRDLPEFVDLVEPEREVEIEGLGELPDVREVPIQDGLAVQNAVNWARFHLSSDTPPGSGLAAAPTSGLGRALVQRGTYLGSGGATRAPQATPSVPAAVGAVGRTIWVEHLLDRFVLERQAPAELAEGLLSLGGAEEAPVRALELHAMLRAHSYGLLAHGQITRVEGLLRASQWEAAGWDDLAPAAPLDRAYMAALRAAGGDALAADPVGAAWLAWGE